MPSFDIYAFLKDIFALFKRHNPKVCVLKYIVAADNESAALAITNVSEYPVTIIDFGFDHAGTLVSMNEAFVQCDRARVKFPQTLEPGAALDMRIAAGAMDLWQADDCYLVDVRGRRTRIKAQFDSSTAR